MHYTVTRDNVFMGYVSIDYDPDASDEVDNDIYLRWGWEPDSFASAVSTDTYNYEEDLNDFMEEVIEKIKIEEFETVTVSSESSTMTFTRRNVTISKMNHYFVKEIERIIKQNAGGAPQGITILSQ